ncbi:MAG: hypothetical protein WC926_00895 [Candidatus Paceibacterota bacterium]|jgi:hypothetical protein
MAKKEKNYLKAIHLTLNEKTGEFRMNLNYETCRIGGFVTKKAAERVAKKLQNL